MKKVFIILFAVLLGSIAVYAVQPTFQTKAKSEIFNALKKYGTNITDTNEEKLTFQYNGAQYHAFVHLLNPTTLYLGLSVGYVLPAGYDPVRANRAALDAASNKPVCSFANGEILMFSSEMYAKDVKNFIAVMPDMLKALSSSVESFQAEYDKLSETIPGNQSYSSVESFSSTSDYIYPKANSGDSKLYIQKVSMTPSGTVLDMVSYNRNHYQWCSISKNSYIMADGVKYPLSKAEGIAYSPSHTDYPDYDSGNEVSLKFKLYFPALPKGTKSFDFMESPSEGWRINGVELEHGDVMAVNGGRIETAYHKWECNAVELQTGQTILTKTVIPKVEGTFMNSFQEEYIEDADTGRKYYLMNSSIGFEGSPEISYDTNPITFYEVYPSLPASVKRINISSGSQYYVKGLRIR